MFMTDLQAEMASECSRATAVAAHDAPWMLWNTYMLSMLCYAFYVYFYISSLKRAKHEKPIDCELTLLHRG